VEDAWADMTARPSGLRLRGVVLIAQPKKG
jgi:hypothetical protein